MTEEEIVELAKHHGIKVHRTYFLSNDRNVDFQAIVASGKFGRGSTPYGSLVALYGVLPENDRSTVKLVIDKIDALMAIPKFSSVSREVTLDTIMAEMDRLRSELEDTRNYLFEVEKKAESDISALQARSDEQEALIENLVTLLDTTGHRITNIVWANNPTNRALLQLQSMVENREPKCGS